MNATYELNKAVMANWSEGNPPPHVLPVIAWKGPQTPRGEIPNHTVLVETADGRLYVVWADEWDHRGNVITLDRFSALAYCLCCLQLRPVCCDVGNGPYCAECCSHGETDECGQTTVRTSQAAVILGRRGGAATKGITTPAKRRAARRNGRLGGRPRTK